MYAYFDSLLTLGASKRQGTDFSLWKFANIACGFLCLSVICVYVCTRSLPISGLMSFDR